MRADYERFDQEVPKSLIPPELHDVEWFYWQAFWELSTDRQAGMSTGPIPWSSIAGYAASHPWVDLSSFVSIMRTMDGVYVAHDSGESKTFSRDMLRGNK